MPELTAMPAHVLASLIRTRAASSVEVVEAYLRRIESVNRAINAVVQLAAGPALIRAREADEALARGEIWGPLHGVPFTAKDVIETAGIVSAAGLEERQDFVPQLDAVVVARMKAAGAILLGKTNCPPGGGGGLTDNPVYGPTLNPYNQAYTPGGSSGGCAAAVAAGLSPLSIGSDSGGSLRLPAHYCGVATLKPTSGRVPNTGVFNHPGGLSDTRTQIGPLARSITDAWLAFTLIAGSDWCDSGVVDMPFGDPDSVSMEGLRVAVYEDDGQAPSTPATVAAVRAAAAVLNGLGATVAHALPDCLPDAWAVTRGYWGMSDLTGDEVEQLLTRWDAFRTAMLQFMRSRDLILCPVDASPAHLLSEDGDPMKFNYTIPFSLTGWPCAVVRAGTSPDGLPIGVQIVGRPWQEHVAVAAAHRIEQALVGGDWHVASSVV